MFDELGSKLDGALKKLRQRGVLTEPMIKEGLREVRRVLLEADVNFKVTRQFLGRVQERALGEQVLKAVSPGQQIVKLVHAGFTATSTLATEPCLGRAPPVAFHTTWRDGAGGTRTHDLRFRKPPLYPAELQPQRPHYRPQPPRPTVGSESRRGGRDRRGDAGFGGWIRLRLRKVRAPQWPGLLGNAQCG